MVTVDDLAHLPRPGSSGADFDTFLELVHTHGVNWPEPVVRDVLFDHGEERHMLLGYGHLDLRAVSWSLEYRSAADLVCATSFFNDFVDEVADHPHFKINQYRQTLPSPWEETWQVPPYFMQGSLLSPPQHGLHLIEGHTRLGILRGLVRLREVTSESLHRVFHARGEERTDNG